MLIVRIERYLCESGTPPTNFGQIVAGDPKLVHEMREGRQPRPALRRHIEAWLDAAEAKLARPKCRAR